jgi:hypothetical protein
MSECVVEIYTVYCTLHIGCLPGIVQKFPGFFHPYPILRNSLNRVLNDLWRTLWSYDSAPRPPPSSSLVSKLSLFLGLPVCRRSCLLTGEGAREKPKSYGRGKGCPSINQQILSVCRLQRLSPHGFSF